jgi:acetyl esterase/lipase
VLVFFYGGSWQSGDRRNYRFVGESFSAAGFVTIIPDYRLYPSVRFPAFIDDGAHAVRWAAEHARDYGGDPERIFLMGHSAGAHIAALLTLDERYLEKAGAPKGVIRATVGLAGPYQFRSVSRAIRAVFDGSQAWSTTQPIHFVDGDEPPMLLLSGALDDVVDPRSASQLASRIREKGGWVRHVVYPALGHIGIVTALAPGFEGRAPVMRDSVNFFRLHGADETVAPWPPPPRILSAKVAAAR